MPYIKPEYRPAFNAAILGIGRFPTDDVIEMVMVALELRKLEEIDGCMNYFITKIIKNRQYITDEEGKVIIGVILKVYENPLSYFYINRFKGLMSSIIDELRDRGWDTPENISFLVKTKMLFHFNFVIVYEARKRKENGDID